MRALRRIACALALLASPALATDVTIGTSAPYPPFQMRDARGGFIGLEPELLAMICARAGWTCTWQEMAFEDLFDALDQGRIDIAATALGYTPARAARVHMTCPYNPRLTNGQFFTTDPAHDPRNGPVAAAIDTLFAEYLTQAGYDLHGYADESAALAALIQGVVPAYFGGEGFADNHPAFGRLTPGDIIQTASAGTSLAVTPSRPDLGPAVDAQLAALSETGAITALLRQWLGSDEAIENPIALCDRQTPTS